MKRLFIIGLLQLLIGMHSKRFCFCMFCVLIILPNWCLFGKVGLLAGFVGTPLAFFFFYKRIMLTENAIRDMKGLREELEKLRN